MPTCSFAHCHSTDPLYSIDLYRFDCNHVVATDLVACRTHAFADASPRSSTCQLCSADTHVYPHVNAPL